MALHRLLTMSSDVEDPVGPFHPKSLCGLHRRSCVKNSMGVYSLCDLAFND